VLQEGELERVGGLKTIKLDVRIICCTNQNIEEQVEKGLFRRDLYYRINVVEINLPPLRERLEDIKPLSHFFINSINNSYGLGVTEVENEVYALFNQYDWAGNVRELQHVLERACLTAAIGSLKLEHFDFILPRIYKKDKVIALTLNNDYNNTSLNNITSEVEKEKIIKTLIETKNNKTLAAKLLNIDRSSLYNKLKKYNIKI
jgi:transcriptional regulator with PAS, ATPase and Fis domain